MPEKMLTPQPRYKIDPEFRKFLQEHMERGKTVDGFLGELDTRSKEYAAARLTLDRELKDAHGDYKKSKAAVEKIGKLNEQYNERLTNTVIEYTKMTFLEFVNADSDLFRTYKVIDSLGTTLSPIELKVLEEIKKRGLVPKLE